MVESKEEVVERLVENSEELQDLGVARISLFGPFVRREQTNESDVDLVIEFQPGLKSFDRFMALCFRLVELLQRRVEIVTPEALSDSYLAPHILSELELIPLPKAP